MMIAGTPRAVGSRETPRQENERRIKTYKPTYKLRSFLDYHFDKVELFSGANKPYLYPVV
jgi:hypothetical protein